MSLEEVHVKRSLNIIVKSSFIVFAGILLSKLLTYAYRIIIAREFGASAYGNYTLALMVIGWFTIFSGLGLSEGLSRYLPLFRGKKDTTSGKYLYWKANNVVFFTGMLSALLLFFLSPLISVHIFHEQSLTLYLQLFALTIPFSLLISHYFSALRSYEHIGWFSFLSNVLMNALFLGFLLLLISSGFEERSIIYSYVLGIGCMFFISLIVSRRKVGELTSKSNSRPGLLREVITYSIPLFLSGIAWKIFRWGDSLVIGIFLESSQVGIYNAAVPIAMLLGIASQLFMALFFPLITKYYAQKEMSTVSTLSRQVTKWIFSLSLPLFVLMIIFPDFFVHLFFGETYLSSANSLRILAIGVFFLSFFDIAYRIIAMKGESRLLLMNILGVSVFNIALNLILVPRWGIEGAAFSTMVSLLMITALLVYQSRRVMNIVPYHACLPRILISGILPLPLLILGSVYISVDNLLISLFIFGSYVLAYLALVLLLKGFDAHDILVGKSIYRKFSS